MNKKNTTTHAKALQALHMTTSNMKYQPRPASISITAGLYAAAGEYERAMRAIGYTAPALCKSRARAYRIMQRLFPAAPVRIETVALPSPAAAILDERNAKAARILRQQSKYLAIVARNNPAAAEKMRRKDERAARKSGKEAITGFIPQEERKAPRPKKEYPAIDRDTIAANPYRYGLKAVQAALRGNPSPTIWKYKTAAAVALGAVRRIDIAVKLAAATAEKVNADDTAAKSAHAAAEKACKAYRAARNSTQAEKDKIQAEREKIRADIAPMVEKATRAKKENSAILAMDEYTIAEIIGKTVIADLVQEAILAMLTADKDNYAAGVRRVYAVMQAERRKADPIICPPAPAGSEEKEFFLVNIAAKDDTEKAAECSIIMEWISNYCAGKIPRERAWAAYNGAARNISALSAADRKMLSRIFAAALAEFTL